MMRALDELHVREALIERIRARRSVPGHLSGVAGAVRHRAKKRPEERGLGHLSGRGEALSRRRCAFRTWAGISWSRAGVEHCCARSATSRTSISRTAITAPWFRKPRPCAITLCPIRRSWNKRNVCGVQFHPEIGTAGLEIVRNFVDAGQTNHSVSRCHRRPRGEGRELRQPARCRRSGGAGRAL